VLVALRAVVSTDVIAVNVTRVIDSGYGDARIIVAVRGPQLGLIGLRSSGLQARLEVTTHGVTRLGDAQLTARKLVGWVNALAMAAAACAVQADGQRAVAFVGALAHDAAGTRGKPRHDALRLVEGGADA